MKGILKIKEVPNIKDDSIYKHLIILDNINNIAQKLILEIINRNSNVKVSIGLISSILDRIVECSRSIQHLAIKGFFRDVAILLLNIIELRLDLQYISLSKGRENIWFEHNQQNKIPWKVANQFQAIYGNTKDLESEQFIYKQCSMTKHGNPAGSTMSFCYSLNKDKLHLSRNNNILLRTFLYATGTNIYKACNAGLEILRKERLNFPIILDELNKVQKEFDDLFSNELNSLVMEYVRQQNPEIDKLDREIKKLEEEKAGCLKKLTEIEKELKFLENDNKREDN